VTYFYELMDSAYDAQEITEHSRSLNHVPIVDPNNRGRSQSVIAPGAAKRELSWAEADHYKERTMMERVNGRLKDEFGGRTVRVRGAVKVMAHLMRNARNRVRSAGTDGRSASEVGQGLTNIGEYFPL